MSNAAKSSCGNAELVPAYPEASVRSWRVWRGPTRARRRWGLLPWCLLRWYLPRLRFVVWHTHEVYGSLQGISEGKGGMGRRYFGEVCKEKGREISTDTDRVDVLFSNDKSEVMSNKHEYTDVYLLAQTWLLNKWINKIKWRSKVGSFFLFNFFIIFFLSIFFPS